MKYLFGVFAALFISFWFLPVPCAHAMGVIRIMPLGDSITEGGYTKDGAYHNQDGGYRLPLELEILPLNSHLRFVGSLAHGPEWMPQRNHEGHSGWRIEQITEKIEGWLKAYRPDIVLLLIGTNNMWEAQHREHASELYEQLVDKIWTTLPHAEIIAGSIIRTCGAETNGYMEEYNAQIQAIIEKKIAQGRHAKWVDMRNASGITSEDLIDCVHPTPEGFKKMARVWFEALKPEVCVNNLFRNTCKP